MNGNGNSWKVRLRCDSIESQGARIRRGDRVRLRPHAGGDVFDLALQGKFAVIESIEQDYEGRLHICVVLDDDPGRDIGLMRQPGHRFFFALSEVEPARQRRTDAECESETNTHRRDWQRFSGGRRFRGGSSKPTRESIVSGRVCGWRTLGFEDLTWRMR